MYKTIVLLLCSISPLFAMKELTELEKMEEAVLIQRHLRYEGKLYTEKLVEDLEHYFKFPDAIKTIKLHFTYRIMQKIQRDFMTDEKAHHEMFALLATDKVDNTQALFTRLDNHYKITDTVTAQQVISIIATYFMCRGKKLKLIQSLRKKRTVTSLAQQRKKSFFIQKI